MKLAIIAVGLFMAASSQAAVVSIDIPEFDPSGGAQLYSEGTDFVLLANASIHLNLDSVRTTQNSSVVYKDIVAGGYVEAFYLNFGGGSEYSVSKQFLFYENSPSQLVIDSNGTEMFTATAIAEDGELATWRATLPTLGLNRSELSLNELFLEPIKNFSMGQPSSGYAGENYLETSVDFSTAAFGGERIYWRGNDMVLNFKANIITDTIATPVPAALALLPSGLLGLLTLARRKRLAA